MAPCYDERVDTSARFCPERRYRCSGGGVETRSNGTRALSAQRLVPDSAKPIEIKRHMTSDYDKPKRFRTWQFSLRTLLTPMLDVGVRPE